MKQSVLRLAFLSFMVAATAGAPVPSIAQTTNKTVAEKKSASASTNTADIEKPGKGGPFHGKLAAIDKVAKTITVGKRTFQITSETKIKKAAKPATLEDGVVGETVSGYVKPTADGKLMATTVNFGPKVNAETGDKQKTAAPDKNTQPK